MRVTLALNHAWQSLSHHGDAQERQGDFAKTIQLLNGNPKCFIVGANNVGSNAVDSYVSPEEGCGVDGQEHHDAQGH